MKYKVIHRTYIESELMVENEHVVNKKYSVHLQSLENEKDILYMDMPATSQTESRLGMIWDISVDLDASLKERG